MKPLKTHNWWYIGGLIYIGFLIVLINIFSFTTKETKEQPLTNPKEPVTEPIYVTNYHTSALGLSNADDKTHDKPEPDTLKTQEEDKAQAQLKAQQEDLEAQIKAQKQKQAEFEQQQQQQTANLKAQLNLKINEVQTLNQRIQEQKNIVAHNFLSADEKTNLEQSLTLHQQELTAKIADYEHDQTLTADQKAAIKQIKIDIAHKQEALTADNLKAEEQKGLTAEIETLEAQLKPYFPTLKEVLQQETEKLTNDVKNKAEAETKLAQLQTQRTTTLAEADQIKHQIQALQEQKNTFEANVEYLEHEKQQTANLNGLEHKLRTLNKNLIYIEANRLRIKELLPDAKDEDKDHLQSYDLFLEGQLMKLKQDQKHYTEALKAFKEKKDYQVPKKKITFKDVFGMETTKTEFEDLIHFFKNDNEELMNFDEIAPKGILLYGPPGTGKSFFIKAFCNEADVHFIELEPSKFDKTYVGEGNEELERIWKEAEQHQKTIIFIDEISGLANREDKNSNDTAKNIVNNLLTKLDGFKSNAKNKIVLMGATNHLDKIDKALRSRFSKEMKIDLLPEKDIYGFLKHQARKYQMSYHTFRHLKEIAKQCEGKNFTNRDYVKILTESYLKTSKHKSHEPLNHEVMLPSDLDEYMDNKLSRTTTLEEQQTRRKASEQEYQAWRKGLLKHLQQPDMTKVEKNYVFNRLTGHDKMPNDLVYEGVKPFNEWKYEYPNTILHTPIRDDFTSSMWNEEKDSILNNPGKDIKIFVTKDMNNHTITIEYKGPKHLIETDKDYYIGEVKNINKEYHDDVSKSKTYYFHFNPVHNTLKVYPYKLNTKDNAENKDHQDNKENKEQK